MSSTAAAEQQQQQLPASASASVTPTAGAYATPAPPPNGSKRGSRRASLQKPAAADVPEADATAAPAATSLAELSQGAFLTEAGSWGDETPARAAAADEKEEEGQEAKQDELDEQPPEEEEEEAKEKEAADDEEEEEDAPPPVTAAAEEEKSNPPADHHLVVVPRRSSVTTPSSTTTMTMTRQTPPAGGRKKHLFAYTSLFGHSRAAIAQARTTRLNAIEARYDEDMQRREMERMSQQLADQAKKDVQAQLRAEQAAYLARCAHATKLRSARARFLAEQDARTRDAERQDRSHTVAQAKKQSRQHEAEATRKEILRAHELRTLELLERHRTISSRWESSQSEAVRRFEADNERRLEQTRKNRQREGEAMDQWSKKVAALELQDPLVKQHALGFQASRGEGVSYPPPKQPHLLTPRPPTAASEEDQPQAHVGGRKRGGFGGAATTARLPALPAHGKGRPRRGNVINDFDSENASGGGQRGGRRARSSGGEDGDVSPSASSSVSPSRARSSSPSRSPSRDGRALGARSKRSSGYGPGGGYDVRSPSSKYALVPKGKKTGGTTTTAAGDATAGTDATTTDPAGAPPAPAASPPAVPEVQPSKITFWPDFATVLLLLDPAAVPLEDTQQSKPDEPAAGGQSEKDALYEDLQKQLAGVFGDLARPSSLATSGLLSARPAADTRRWTYAALVRPSRKGAVRIKIEDARKATRGEEQQGEGEREDEAQKTAASAEVGGNHAASASDDTVPSEHATDAAETATTLSAQENELEA